MQHACGKRLRVGAALLRRRQMGRQRTELDLAVDADVSTRHLLLTHRVAAPPVDLLRVALPTESSLPADATTPGVVRDRMGRVPA